MQKLKNNEHRQKFTGSYKKTCVQVPSWKYTRFFYKNNFVITTGLKFG